VRKKAATVNDFDTWRDSPAQRAFVKLRELVATHRELDRKLTELEPRAAVHDEAIGQLIDAVRQLMAPLKRKECHAQMR
jgi:hypothetical protein